jgi:hypothetical protein
MTFGRVSLHLIGIAPGKPLLNSNVAIRPSELRESFPKHSHARLRYRIVPRKCVQAPEPPYPVGLLGERRQLPSRRAAEARNEFAPSHPPVSAPVTRATEDCRWVRVTNLRPVGLQAEKF